MGLFVFRQIALEITYLLNNTLNSVSYCDIKKWEVCICQKWLVHVLTSG
eukprot:COSAG02_NODE_4147_length_5715_cov_4.516204_3_plen_49_part_00